MSLFENDEYQWRETYFILFPQEKLPAAEIVVKTLQRMNSRYQIRDPRADESGRLESLTLESPDDYSALDLSLVRGEEVAEQLADLIKDLLRSASSSREKQRIRDLAKLDCRFDVYHFEQLVFTGRDEEDDGEDDFMDPGALLAVMERIADLCGGVIIDPQANVILDGDQ